MAVTILSGVASPVTAQVGTGTDFVLDSASLLRDAGLSAVGSLRNAVDFKVCLGIRESVEVCPEDEIWLVDARESHLCPSDLSLVEVKRFENDNWNPSTLEELATHHLLDPSKETVVFIHGNQTDDRWSLTRGIQVYRNLFKSRYARKPVRLIIFQWRSERESVGFLRDYYVKSWRSVQLGTTLALTLGKFHDRNLTIIGYSLGAQITLSAMQQEDLIHLAGGYGYRIALIAPALDCDFTTLSTNSYSFASVIDQLEIFYNSMDRVLRAHDRICEREFGRHYVTLQKFVQMQIMSLGHVQQYDVAREVGKRHCIVRYSSSATVQSGINRLISSGVSLPRESAISSIQLGDAPVVSADEFLIHDPIQDLDASLETTQAYLFDPLITP
jgi:predicted alpha/beta-fold hydrolase